MQSKAQTVEAYLKEIPAERQASMQKLSSICRIELKGFEEVISYGMIGYVVPKTIYPAGYHCTPELPLPFVNIASQKNFIALYHMGVYGSSKLLDWFVAEYPKHAKGKLDMGKSCIRFKKMDDIPFTLIQELLGKMSMQDWINQYEKLYIKK